jgi:hypothetical protein
MLDSSSPVDWLPSKRKVSLGSSAYSFLRAEHIATSAAMVECQELRYSILEIEVALGDDRTETTGA